MAIVGIVAEYNPFHLGHAWQIGEIRRRFGPETAVVVAMSGNYVQRGEWAVVNKHARAEMALRGGVDLVLELPTLWSAATAERFAHGGVSVLSATGVVTHLAFGSEAGELAPLASAAAALDSDGYPPLLRRCLASGMTFAAARELAVGELTGEEARCLRSPNNNLAVEYLRALKRIGSGIVPVALPRVGAAHDSDAVDGFASASAIRGRLITGDGWRQLVPASTAEIMDGELAAGRAPVTLETCQRAVLSRLRSIEEEGFACYDGGGEGLYHRFYSAVQSCCTVSDILEAAKTKRYTMARLRRMLLHSYLGMVPAAPEQSPPYLRILGAGARGRLLLREMRDNAALPVITQPAESRKGGDEVCAFFSSEARYTDLYTLAYPRLSCSVPGSEYLKSPIML